MTISVIIRTQYRPLFLQRAICSVMQQTFSDWEILIVNDGGKEVIVNDPRIRYLRHETPLGRSIAASRGLQKAQGEYAIFLDDDDTWHPTFLERAVDKLKEGYLAVAAHCYKVTEVVKGEDIVEKKRELHRPLKKDVLLFELAMGNFLPIHSCLFQRALALEVGGIDESLPLLEDWDFFLRLVERTEMAMITTPLVYYHLRREGRERNTVIENRQLCVQCESYIRNKYLRRDLSRGLFGLGALLNMAEATRDLSLWRCIKNDLLHVKSTLFR